MPPDLHALSRAIVGLDALHPEIALCGERQNCQHGGEEPHGGIGRQRSRIAVGENVPDEAGREGEAADEQGLRCDKHRNERGRAQFPLRTFDDPPKRNPFQATHEDTPFARTRPAPRPGGSIAATLPSPRPSAVSGKDTAVLPR